jgi:EAL domain-containing protein (putative c-di-GMP-specific phosphodiesterase class I)
LLRWRDPDRGLVAPGDFLPVAEQSGLILPIGEWIMHAACRQAQAWRVAGYAPLPVLVNLSAVQLARDDVSRLVERALADCGLSPDGLGVEITESTLMERVEDVLPMLHRLRDLGVRIAVDDFGTGYSSLSYLSRLPLHTLKIDRSFVQAVDVDHHPAAITRAVIQLARDLGLTVVAEGVETEQQRAWLQAHGCHAFQGFLRSKPLPPADFVNQVLQGARAPSNEPMAQAGA